MLVMALITLTFALVSPLVCNVWSGYRWKSGSLVRAEIANREGSGLLVAIDGLVITGAIFGDCRPS